MDFFGADSGVTCTEGVVLTSVTLDSGASWVASPSHLNLGGYIDGPVSGRNSCFLDVNHIWFCNGSTICHTSDAGQTWVLDTNQTPLGYSVKSIYFIDSLTGFEGGAGYSLFRTSDGGKTWSIVYDSASEDGSVYQIKFCSPKLGLALCGEYLTYILRTTDGGMNWTNDTVGGGGAPTGLSYPDPHNAWYTDAAWLYHSTDSGLTWTTVIDNPLGYGGFRSSCFLDSIHGIATGGSHVLIIGYTSDGGKSWQTTSIDSEGSDETFTSFPNTNTAYVGGLDAVYKLVPSELSVQPSQLTISKMEVYPNPFTQSTTITISTAESGIAEISVVNLLGQELARIYDGELSAGEHSFTWSASSVPPGMYECIVRMNGTSQEIPMMLER
jgi:hypothetical protein